MLSEHPRKRLAVLGQPISHSLSPAIHGAALKKLGMEADWSYEAIEVAAEDLAGLIRSMPGDGFVGANVTVPHKVAALACADLASPTAEKIGAANTLNFTDDGICAENTDSQGLLGAISEPVEGRSALVLGAGGAARAAVWGLHEARAEVSIWNRTAATAQQLAASLGGSVVEPGSDGSLDLGRYDLLVNTTSVGLQSVEVGDGVLKALHLDADAFGEHLTVIDLVYTNSETELLRVARERGAVTVDGREVLVHQAAASFDIWTGIDPPISVMREAAGLN